jgi:predicted component of type VI protein secretion system
VESLADGQVAAWVVELPDCRVVAESKAAAIAQLEPLIDVRMATIEVKPLSVQPQVSEPEPHPITEFFGIFKGDPDFAEIVAQMRAERELDDENPAYTLNW